MKVNNIIKTGLLLAVAYFMVAIASLLNFSAFAGQGGEGATSCDVISSSKVVIGNQSSKEIVATHAQNAYVIVTQPINATNTVSLGFDTDATTASGFVIGSSTATYHPTVLEMGLNTDFPYTGAVNAITNLGSTTIGVTICRY